MRLHETSPRSGNPDEIIAPASPSGADTFLRLLSYIRPYWPWMGLTIFALIVSSLLGLVLPLVVRNLIDFVIVNKDFTNLNMVTVGLLVVFLLQALFSFTQHITLAYICLLYTSRCV